MNKIYVGNLPYSASESELEDLFAQFGKIVSVNVIKDKYTGRSKGFGFIEFEGEEQAKAAVSLDGNDMDGRPLRVSVAREQQRSGGGNRGGDRERRDW